MGFGGKDECVQGSPIDTEIPRCRYCLRYVMIAGDFCSQDCQKLFDGKHGLNKPSFTCDYLDCMVKVLPGRVLCDEHTLKVEQDRRAPGYEFVDHPKHYNDHPAGIECIDVIEHMTFNTGSAVKYLWRVGLKPGEDPKRDFDKALWYINREKERLENFGKVGRCPME